MGKVILFGEPMALLIADTVGPLEEVKHFTRAMSGAEINVGIGLLRLGHEVSFTTRLGDDPFGHYIKNTLEEKGIEMDYVTFDNIFRTGIQLKSKVNDGSNPHAPYYRKESAASKISSKEIDLINFKNVNLLHITGIPPALSKSSREATYRLIERAKENNVFITFDPNLRPALWENKEVMIKVINDLASKVDIVLPGIEECEILAGTNNLEEAAKFYLNNGAKVVIIKNGSNGAYVNDGYKSFSVDGFKVDKVIDTVGAGDGFAVGVISSYLEGLSLLEMVKRGNAIGAIQVKHISDNEGLPTREELEFFMKK